MDEKSPAFCHKWEDAGRIEAFEGVKFRWFDR